MDETVETQPTPVAEPPVAEEIPAAKAAPASAEAGAATGPAPTPRPSGDTLKDALKQVENVGQALGAALQGRGNVVMVRVNDETLKQLDMLVEAEITKSRSESAALMITEGIKANDALYARITEIANQIAHLRARLRESIKPEPEEQA
ncbi:MAG: hypothetical protein GYA17_14655 [Chloroflexi bacterium]|nr:hypothetical protein [Chloroflexota bacterium]